jgi:hypothetical protein
MPEWWTYTLGDFLMFSPRAYARLIERYNAGAWPWQLVGWAAAAAVLGLRLRPRRAGAAAAALLLGGTWVAVAYGFFWERYAAINFAARPLAALCALEAVLLFRAARNGGLEPARAGDRRAGIGTLLLAAALLYPALAPLLGHGWRQAEIVGLMPDPTAIATIGWLLTMRGRGRGLLLAPPLLLGAVGTLTLVALRRPEAAAPGLALLLGGAALARGKPAE